MLIILCYSSLTNCHGNIFQMIVEKIVIWVMIFLTVKVLNMRFIVDIKLLAYILKKMFTKNYF